MVNASDLKSDEQKMFLSVRSRSGVQIIKSPSEMNKVGRAVKGSAIMCYRFYYKAGGRIGTRTENPRSVAKSGRTTPPCR